MRQARKWRSRTALIGAAVVAALSCMVTPLVSAEDGEGILALLERRVAAGDLTYRDNRSGEVVVATEARVAEIRRSLEAQFDVPAGARIDVTDDGTVSADIDGAMRDVYIVRTRLDGTRERGCFRDLDAAVAFIIGLDIDTAERNGTRSPAAMTE